MNKKTFKKRNFMLSFILILSLVISSFAFKFSFATTEDGSWENPYTVAQANNTQNNTLKTLQGYIVGQPTATTTVITSNYPNDYAIAIADIATETNTSKMIYVQIPTASRTTFGLKTNPSLKGSKVKITGYLTAYFTHTGVKNVSAMAKATQTIPETGGTSPYDGTYYALAVGKTGESLKRILNDIISNQTKISYNAVWDALRYTDQDPNNTNNVILLYTGRSQSKLTNGGLVNDWNREHVFAKSHGDFGTSTGPGTDLHHLRPTDVSVNGARGNLDFDMGGTYNIEATECKSDNDSWEPRDSVKGDIARMIFYMAVRYEGENGEVDLELNNLTSNTTAPYMGKLSTLLLWNAQDPVDDFERNRNDVIYTKYQHNRNPFIDHSEWANAIFN
ncbi:endonuclease [Clostridium sp.]|uniref:endonuclease n=1 Tax=Clostridium sp. TaxID=1506 RepID=UPI003D6D4E4D